MRFLLPPQNANKPKPQPRSKLPPPTAGPAHPSAPPELDFPSLPNVPSDLPDVPQGGGGAAGKRDDDDEIDFDELSRRFENLKKRKWWATSCSTLYAFTTLLINYDLY